MKHSFVVMALIGVGLLNVANASAQNANDNGAAVTVTGCLAQGDQPGAYRIQDPAGKIYGLMGSTVNLKPHVGHQVTITGTPVKGGGHDKSDTKPARSESVQLQVSDLKMVSATCP